MAEDTSRVRRFVRKHRRLCRLVAVLGLVAVSYCAFTFLGSRQRVMQEPTPTYAFPAVVTAIPVPTARPTLSPTRTPTPSPIVTDCTWSAIYVADVTIPDGTVLEPGVRFTKTWRIQNAGTCPWSGVSLVFTSGDQMSGSTVLIPDTAPGDEVEVSVPMITSHVPGDYSAAWTVCRIGYCFGGVTVVIVVAGGTL